MAICTEIHGELYDIPMHFSVKKSIRDFAENWHLEYSLSISYSLYKLNVTTFDLSVTLTNEDAVFIINKLIEYFRENKIKAQLTASIKFIT